jgi:hypothetical protein
MKYTYYNIAKLQVYNLIHAEFEPWRLVIQYTVTYPGIAWLVRRVMDSIIKFIKPLYNWLQQFTYHWHAVIFFRLDTPWELFWLPTELVVLYCTPSILILIWVSSVLLTQSRSGSIENTASSTVVFTGALHSKRMLMYCCVRIHCGENVCCLAMDLRVIFLHNYAVTAQLQLYFEERKR